MPTPLNADAPSNVPHRAAEHMAAPTTAAKCSFFLPTRSRPHLALRIVLHRHRTLVACDALGSYTMA